MAQVTLSPGKRGKERLLREMKRRLLADMTTDFVGFGEGAEAYTEAHRRAETLVQGRFEGRNQRSYDEIPIYPKCSPDGIKSDARYPQFAKLYSQLGDHCSEVASMIISTHQSVKRWSGKLPVTPQSPTSQSILLPAQGVPANMEMDAAVGAGRVTSKAESSKDVKRARLERACAGPNAKIPSKKRVDEEEGNKEKIIPGKDTYHIIRVHQPSLDRYLELLRQDSDGYIGAFRILDSLDLFLKAYWCAFSDFEQLPIHLPFMNFRFLDYESGYGHLDNIYYGEGTLDAIINEFLSRLYANPNQPADETKKKYFYIICLLFGECPRLEAARKFVEYHSVIPDYLCRDQRYPELKLGSLLNNLIRTWSNTCDTALSLLVCLFEKFIKADIEVTRSNSSSIPQFINLFRQFEYNQRKADQRCRTAMKSFESIFHLIKDSPSGSYGEMALYQLLNEQLHVLRHEYILVPSAILRRGGFRHKITFAEFNEESNNIGNEPVSSPEVVFWHHFDIFRKLETRRDVDLMMFLDEAKAFLVKYGFGTAFPVELAVLVEKLTIFNGIRWKVDIHKRLGPTSGDVAFAATTALSYGVGVEWKEEYTRTIVRFLRDWRREHNEHN